MTNVRLYAARTAAGNKGNKWGKTMMRLVFAAIVAADLAAIMIYPAERPTFEQRWIPAHSMPSPYKGDRLPVGPPEGFYTSPVPAHAKPRSNWLANPHIGTRIACTSFCEFP